MNSSEITGRGGTQGYGSEPKDLDLAQEAKKANEAAIKIIILGCIAISTTAIIVLPAFFIKGVQPYSLMARASPIWGGGFLGVAGGTVYLVCQKLNERRQAKEVHAYLNAS